MEFPTYCDIYLQDLNKALGYYQSLNDLRENFQPTLSHHAAQKRGEELKNTCKVHSAEAWAH